VNGNHTYLQACTVICYLHVHDILRIEIMLIKSGIYLLLALLILITPVTITWYAGMDEHAGFL
jgi:hypothetical protein